MSRRYERSRADISVEPPRLARRATGLGAARSGPPSPRLDVQLAQDRRDVVVDGARGEEEPLGDRRVAEPSARRRSTSSSRAVSRASFRRVLDRGPRGTLRTPRSCRRRATIAAAGRAPSRCSSSSAWRSGSSSSASPSASAASHGQPGSRHRSAARVALTVSPGFAQSPTALEAALFFCASATVCIRRLTEC
jgi:hypothetical protein